VIAGVALIAILALVAVPGTVGHQLTVQVVDEAFAPVVVDSPTGTVASTFEPANRSASAVALTTTFREPGATPGARARVALPGIAGSGGTVRIPRPPSAVGAAPSAGGWRTSGSSWYGPGLYGHGTACGQTLTTTLVGVAHKTLPCGTVVEFRNPSNGRVVTARVVDRGPYVSGRAWDLTAALCRLLDHCYTAPIQWQLP
jgi:Lytic transglycolase